MSETDLRVVKTVEIIRESFLYCLETIGFKNMTVKNITEHARINRSTFYKHYEDKYDLRDKYVDEMVRDFITNLETNFIDLDILNVDTYYVSLKGCLEAFLLKKREYEILWNANLYGRNAFEEMLTGGIEKLKLQMSNSNKIEPQKKFFLGLYARLFLGNMMNSIRWWFEEGASVPADRFTTLMIYHMSEGILPTLRNKDASFYQQGK